MQSISAQSDSSATLSIEIGKGKLSIEDVLSVAFNNKGVALSNHPAFKERIKRGADFLERLLANDGIVYGVNTGYGDSCTVMVPSHLVAELPLHLTRYHGCGLGEYLDDHETLAVLVCRLNSLAQGYSGVRWELLAQLSSLINFRILPNIPAEGSVGASGDLTPLSYVAAALIGEREVRYTGKTCPTSEVLASLGIAPITLAPKEGLAIMNGTAVMTGLACIAWQRAHYLSKLCCRLTALASIALRGNRGHFDPRLFAAKPHAGQNEAAAWIYDDLCGNDVEEIRLQDRYSIRCAPHVIGVVRDALTWMRRDIENELNSANDNPLIDGENELVLHGGHFYGGHIAFAMDSLKTAVANLADLMDRQLALLVDSKYNHGLPQNLSGSTGERAAINHGFKAVQIGASAWTAEALKLTMPASVFSRSTECHNQDKVSMGTIAARDCLRVLELTEQVAAAMTLAAVQGVTLRQAMVDSDDSPTYLPANLQAFMQRVRAYSPFLDEDRALEMELREVTQLIRAGHWELYPDD
ncbi:MAG: histidine ammonia-lyase [Methylophilaceae bacterium 17-44-8]|jgi:histidine ammonia-lyase|nr:MAG: histidine ammonia-lyase [Methylophilales bacterium 28-44-11]OZA05182.1 MAG: histidine ammonia-lyase [Methylophilaceae bacterium 17-44-8]